MITRKRTAVGRLWIAASIVLLSAALVVAAEPAGKKTSRLFILSGQSNMAGLNPNISFTPAVTKAFSNDEVIVVKSAQGGQPIRRWYKKWKAPAGMKIRAFKAGDLYDQMMAAVKKQVGTRSFDSFTSVSFVWMQGERDAKERVSGVYAESMRGLIAQLRSDLGRPDMTAVIGRLSDCIKNNAHWEGVRKAQSDVAAGDKLVAVVDTDDLNGPRDGLHYTKDGYKTLGQRFADEAITLSGGKAATTATATVKTLKKDDRIIFLGDSITAAGVRPNGYVTLTAQRIAKAYPALNVKVIGAGISGHKVPDCQKRLDRDVIKKKPTIVLIYIGINDVWHWNNNRGTKKADFESGLHDLIKRINAAGARVILCTPTVIGEKTDGSNKMDKMLDEYSAISRKVAAATGSQMLDLRKLFLAYLKKHNKNNAARGVLTGDTVHLNSTGNRFLADLMLGALGVPTDAPKGK